MKKNLRVIQINGFRGIVLAICIVTCLIAGFIVFPGYLLMNIWNSFLTKFVSVPMLGLVQGTLLWGIAVVSYMIIRKRHIMISFKRPTELSDDELSEVMERIKFETTSQIMHDVIAKSQVDQKPNIVELDSTNEADKEIEITNKNIDN